MSTHTYRAVLCLFVVVVVDNDGNEIVPFFFALRYCMVGACRLYDMAREDICDLDVIFGVSTKPGIFM
jgi:hypothetical protein